MPPQRKGNEKHHCAMEKARLTFQGHAQTPEGHGKKHIPTNWRRSTKNASHKKNVKQQKENQTHTHKFKTL